MTQLPSLILRGGGMAIFHLIIKSLIIVSGTLFGIFETLTTDASFCRHVFKLLKGLKEFDSNHGTQQHTTRRGAGLVPPSLGCSSLKRISRLLRAPHIVLFCFEGSEFEAGWRHPRACDSHQHNDRLSQSHVYINHKNLIIRNPSLQKPHFR